MKIAALVLCAMISLSTSHTLSALHADPFLPLSCAPSRPPQSIVQAAVATQGSDGDKKVAAAQDKASEGSSTAASASNKAPGQTPGNGVATSKRRRRFAHSSNSYSIPGEGVYSAEYRETRNRAVTNDDGSVSTAYEKKYMFKKEQAKEKAARPHLKYTVPYQPILSNKEDEQPFA